MPTLKKLLKELNLDNIKSMSEVNASYKKLCTDTKSLDKKVFFTYIYKEIKKKINTKPKSNENITIINIKQNCNKCKNKYLSGLKINSGTIKIKCKCNKKRNVLFKKPVFCKKCKKTGFISIKCPACQGKTYVKLKRKVNVLL